MVVLEAGSAALWRPASGSGRRRQPRSDHAPAGVARRTHERSTRRAGSLREEHVDRAEGDRGQCLKWCGADATGLWQLFPRAGEYVPLADGVAHSDRRELGAPHGATLPGRIQALVATPFTGGLRCTLESDARIDLDGRR